MMTREAVGHLTLTDGKEAQGVSTLYILPRWLGSLLGENLCTGRKVWNHTLQHINCENKYFA